MTAACHFPVARRPVPGCNLLALDPLRSIRYPRTPNRKPTCAFWIGVNLLHSPAHVFQQAKALKALRFCRRMLVLRLMGDCRTPLPIAKKARPRPEAATILHWIPLAASGIPELWIGVNLSYSAAIAESLRCHTQMYSNQQIDTAPLEQ